MNNFIQVSFKNIEPQQAELLIAQLAEIGFDGFEEQERRLNAFIPEKDFDRSLLSDLAAGHQVSFEEQLIAEKNWNEVWESSFQPVTVDDFAAIRADFHQPEKGVEYEIVITPKMSFGTGHHATTFMMIQQMRAIDFKDKSVFDFGTGTGVLAILAEKCGAVSVKAIDNDEWSITNANENIERNKCNRIKTELSAYLPAEEKYDIVLANINKNVILENFLSLVQLLKKDSTLLLSGLLEEDENDIMSRAADYPLQFTQKTAKTGWIALRFKY